MPKDRKIGISFTWDDNFNEHYKYVAPIFKEWGCRCTFYINPGEENFTNFMANQYKELSEQGFEIGSHGFVHDHYSRLSYNDFYAQLIKSKNAITALTNKPPLTFAFPHHDFTNDMLAVARSVYKETRNTLNNTVRFSLKTKTDLESVKTALNNAINDSYNIVFSGHSVFKQQDEINNCGYEPISVKLLSSIISTIVNEYKLPILTFEELICFTQIS
ncbi:MAG: polysaccharide deacetylase family protein [Clostridiales bacterium]|nr:polysaccharide deacetylase family protein [Clostridiales bacterium]